MGYDRGSVWTHTSVGGNGDGVRGFHRGGGARRKCMAVRTFSPTGGHWHRRRVGARRHVRGGSMAGRSAQNGRRVFTDGLLFWFFSRRCAELHRWSTFWLARNVSLRSGTGDRFCPYHCEGKRTGALEAEVR